MENLTLKEVLLGTLLLEELLLRAGQSWKKTEPYTPAPILPATRNTFGLGVCANMCKTTFARGEESSVLWVAL